MRIELTSLAWKAKVIAFIRYPHKKMAVLTGLEPVIFAVTGRYPRPTERKHLKIGIAKGI